MGVPSKIAARPVRERITKASELGEPVCCGGGEGRTKPKRGPSGAGSILTNLSSPAIRTKMREPTNADFEEKLREDWLWGKS